MADDLSKIWVPFRQRSGDQRLRLVCFPYAGGAAQVFRDWWRDLPGVDVWPVQLPGRWTRLREAPMTSVTALAAAAAGALAESLDDGLPLAVFGHSLGATIAYEFVRALPTSLAPQRLFVSARVAPHYTDCGVPPLHTLPDAAFIDAMVHRYGVLAPQVLEEPDLLAMAIPYLRADLQAHETYVHQERPPLSLPIVAIAGRQDKVIDAPRLAEWQRHSSLPLVVEMLDGDHFYINKRRQALTAIVAAHLAALS